MGTYVEEELHARHRLHRRPDHRRRRDGWPVEPGRYRLVVARACPWANRAIIVRRLLGLEDAISMGSAGRPTTSAAGPSTSTRAGSTRCCGSRGSRTPTSRASPTTRRGITVPAIVDVPTGQVVTNDFPQITLDLSTEWRALPPRPGAPDLYPEALRDEIDEVRSAVYTDVNNGVYRCGFAGAQERLRAGVRPAVRRAGLAVASGWPTGATSWATPSPRPTCGCSPRWCGSTRSTTATSSATGRS